MFIRRSWSGTRRLRVHNLQLRLVTKSSFNTCGNLYQLNRSVSYRANADTWSLMEIHKLCGVQLVEKGRKKCHQCKCNEKQIDQQNATVWKKVFGNPKRPTSILLFCKKSWKSEKHKGKALLKLTTTNKPNAVIFAISCRKIISYKLQLIKIDIGFHVFIALVGTHQFDLFCTSTIFISSTFSVLRPLYFALSTSTSLLRTLYFNLLSNLDFLLVEKHGSKYSFGGTKEVEVKFWSR